MFTRIVISPFDETVTAVILTLNNKYYFLVEDVVDYSDIGCCIVYEPACLLEIGTDGKFHGVKNHITRSEIESVMGYNNGSVEYSIVNNLYNIIESNALDPEHISEFIKEHTDIFIPLMKDYIEYMEIF